MPSESDDLHWVKAFLDGDIDAFDHLFTKYHPRVRASCLRMLGDEAAAEDVVQETFFNVVRALPRVDAEVNFGAWIHRIALNLCRDELRRRNRRTARQENNPDVAETALLRVADHDIAGQPDLALEMANLRRLVWAVGRKLPERQRMVLTLRELQGLSYASIARVMGVSESAVETLLHRARKRFRDEFLLLDSPLEEDVRDEATS